MRAETLPRLATGDDNRCEICGSKRMRRTWTCWDEECLWFGREHAHGKCRACGYEFIEEDEGILE